MNTRSPLCDIDGVQLLTGRTIGAIRAMTDGRDLVDGSYQWVWNVATNPQGKIRDLRFWTGEVLLPARQRNHSLDEVINFLVPPARREFPAGEVCQLLQIRPITLSELRAELNGALRANSGFYPRAGLVKFFQSRWLGNFVPASALTQTILSATHKRTANRPGSDVPTPARTPDDSGAATCYIAPGGVVRTGKSLQSSRKQFATGETPNNPTRTVKTLADDHPVATLSTGFNPDLNA